MRPSGPRAAVQGGLFPLGTLGDRSRQHILCAPHLLKALLQGGLNTWFLRNLFEPQITFFREKSFTEAKYLQTDKCNFRLRSGQESKGTYTPHALMEPGPEPGACPTPPGREPHTGLSGLGVIAHTQKETGWILHGTCARKGDQEPAHWRHALLRLPREAPTGPQGRAARAEAGWKPSATSFLTFTLSQTAF